MIYIINILIFLTSTTFANSFLLVISIRNIVNGALIVV